MARSRGRRRGPWAGLALLLLCLAAFAIHRLALAPGPSANALLPFPRPSEGNLLLHVVDVGQGDAILLETGSAAVLIDGGPDSGAARLLDYLDSREIEKFDLIVATHPHEDHIGGLDDVLNAIPADKILMPDRTADTLAFERLLDAVLAREMKITTAKAGDVYTVDGGLTLTVLSPPEGWDDENTNNWSVVLLAQYGGQSMLLMGDAEKEVEEALAGVLPSSVDFLKAGHHGSNTSSSATFLDRVRPGYAAISLGAGNSYGHPHKEAMARLTAACGALYRTDLQGSLLFVFDGTSVSADTEREAA